MPSFGLTVQKYQLFIFLTRSLLPFNCTEFRSLHTLCDPEIISPSETPRIKVMNNMDKARAALAALPRCAAKSRQSCEQCKNPGLGAGCKCRFHGGASTGHISTHRRLTKANLLNRDWVRLLLGVLPLEHPGFQGHRGFIETLMSNLIYSFTCAAFTQKIDQPRTTSIWTNSGQI